MDNSKNNQSNWYAVYTKPRSEKKVLKILSENGYESYLPLITTIRQWSDRKKKVELPLISSYVFIKTNENNLKDVIKYQGVMRTLKHLGKPAIIKDYEIENLKILLQDTDNIKFTEGSIFERGDIVLVEKGIFKGLIAECIQLNGKHRVILRINGIENLIEVNIPLSYLKKI